jgi:hypothetical protein
VWCVGCQGVSSVLKDMKVHAYSCCRTSDTTFCASAFLPCFMIKCVNSSSVGSTLGGRLSTVYPGRVGACRNDASPREADKSGRLDREVDAGPNDGSPIMSPIDRSAFCSVRAGPDVFSFGACVLLHRAWRAAGRKAVRQERSIVRDMVLVCSAQKGRGRV